MGTRQLGSREYSWDMGSGRPEALAALDVCGEEIVVHLRGEWDLTNAARLEQLLASIDASRHVSFNLSSLEFADSSVLRALAVFKKRSLASGGRTSISFGSHGIKRIFDICGLTEAFQR